jgi:hypothetical protein
LWRWTAETGVGHGPEDSTEGWLVVSA